MWKKLMLRECQVYENKFKIISRCYVILAVKMSCYIFRHSLSFFFVAGSILSQFKVIICLEIYDTHGMLACQFNWPAIS